MDFAQQCETRLPELCQALGQLHPGWHFWYSDQGRPYATHDYQDAFGCGATVDAPGWPRIEEAVVLYEREREREIARMTPLAYASAA